MVEIGCRWPGAYRHRVLQLVAEAVFQPTFSTRSPRRVDAAAIADVSGIALPLGRRLVARCVTDWITDGRRRVGGPSLEAVLRAAARRRGVQRRAGYASRSVDGVSTPVASAAASASRCRALGHLGGVGRCRSAASAAGAGAGAAGAAAAGVAAAAASAAVPERRLGGARHLALQRARRRRPPAPRAMRRPRPGSRDRRRRSSRTSSSRP